MELSAPSSEDLSRVLQLLYDNGINVQNSKKAYDQLQEYQTNPTFTVTLAYIFGLEQSPCTISAPWESYRQIAGITLKNNISNAWQTLGEEAVKKSAKHVLFVLQNPTDIRIARVAASIIVKITAITSFDWWMTSDLGNLPLILLNDLLNSGGLKSLASLFVLQYLMEDVPKQIGEASEDIIKRVSALSITQGEPINLRKAAFRLCFNIFEQASYLDWNIDELSPLQKGLVGSSWSLASASTALLEQSCSGDRSFMIIVFRTCYLLLDYIDYFGTLQPRDYQKIAEWWVTNPMKLLSSFHSSSEGDTELASAAIDLLSGVLEAYQRTAGEGAIEHLAAPILEAIPFLIPSLTQFAPMSDEEVKNIIESDDYRIRDATGVSFDVKEGTKDISEDVLLDDDTAAITLRRSALRCIDQVCAYASGPTFEALMKEINGLWGNTDWRQKEAGIVLVGTMANGCFAEVQTFIPSLLDQLCKSITDSTENPCVVSIAMWAASRMFDVAMEQATDSFHKVMGGIIGQLQSTSKRNQLSAVTALCHAFTTALSTSNAAILQPHLSTLIDSIIVCIPVYTTTNLSLLVDLLLNVILVLNEEANIAKLKLAIDEERKRRAKLFVDSYYSLYIDGNPNALLDKDIFALDRGTIALLLRSPNPNIAVSNLNTWCDVLKDILERNILDDLDLIYNTMSICSGYSSIIPSNRLLPWISQTDGCLPSVAFQFLVRHSKAQVKSEAANLLGNILKFGGASALPRGMSDALMVTLESQIPDVDETPDKANLVRLVSLVVDSTEGAISQNGLSAFRIAAHALRSDAFGESLLYFVQMAHDVCKPLGKFPFLITEANPCVIANILSQTENTYEKAESTLRFCTALISSSADFVVSVLKDLMRMVYSWQQAVHRFPDTYRAIQSLLVHCTQVCRDHLHSLLQSLPPEFRNTVVSFYTLNI